MGLYYCRLEFLSSLKFGSRTRTHLLYPDSKGIFLFKISTTRAENALVNPWTSVNKKKNIPVLHEAAEVKFSSIFLILNLDGNEKS